MEISLVITGVVALIGLILSSMGMDVPLLRDFQDERQTEKTATSGSPTHRGSSLSSGSTSSFFSSDTSAFSPVTPDKLSPLSSAASSPKSSPSRDEPQVSSISISPTGSSPETGPSWDHLRRQDGDLELQDPTRNRDAHEEPTGGEQEEEEKASKDDDWGALITQTLLNLFGLGLEYPASYRRHDGFPQATWNGIRQYDPPQQLGQTRGDFRAIVDGSSGSKNSDGHAPLSSADLSEQKANHHNADTKTRAGNARQKDATADHRGRPISGEEEQDQEDLGKQGNWCQLCKCCGS